GRGGRGNDRNDRSARRGGRGGKRGQQPVQKVEIARPKHIKLPESIAVKDLASKMSYTAAEVIKKLFMMGVMATINQEIDFDTAALVASEFGVTAEELPPEVDPTEIPEIEDDPKTLELRPPVVTVMGHVDHGKTSLLDCIRKTSVSAHEAGGITQHIGAYQVIASGKKIVFLDTPGHEAFTAMRARGAQITDIAILVVAADDGVMPQTIEAISHAKSADVPIIVAINKIDKPGANPDRVKQELMEHGLVPEEYGGNTIMVPVSAKKQIGIDDLLEMVLLVAEVKELKANPNRDARGVIVEAKLDKGRGPVATVLVQNGTLRIGDSIVCGTTFGKVRAMLNDRGGSVKKAGPSVPVEILGLNDVPEAGDILAVLEEKQARSIAEARQGRQRTKLIKAKKVSLDDLFQQIQEGDIKDLNIVVKADVQGSVEALNSSLLQLNKNDEVRVSIVHSGVGSVNESDVMLATASNALIIAFNVRPDANARKLADTENIDIRTYRVIYDALNDVKDAMSGMLKPKYKEVVQGRVEIRQVMKFSKALVAGSYVLDGKICNNSKIRILRDDVAIFDGEIDSLRRFKDEVKEVTAGYECGISIVDFKDFQEGDIIEPYTMEEIAVTITDANKAAAKKREEQEKAAKETEAEA
ncbi:MAG: translation initiation factor IF-2, partial [Mitsuokella sp.]